MMNLFLVLHGITTEINDQIELQNCYSELSRVVLKEDQKEICVQLITTQNNYCNNLPKGIKLSVELDNLSGFYIPTGYFSDFNYSSTTELCVSCTNLACTNHVFFESKTANTILESYAFKTPIQIGVVVRQQSDFANCINQSYVKVSSTQIQVVVEINDYCWQVLNVNSYQLLNNTITLRFFDFTVQKIYTPSSTDIVLTIVGGSFVFFIDEPNSFVIFDENDFIEFEMKIGIQQSNTVNFLLTSSNQLQIDELTSGYSSLRLRVNTNSMQLSGVPSDIGKLYAQMAGSQHFDEFHIKLQIQFGEDAYIFESSDLQTYQDGQTQSFSCSTEKCNTNMLYVYNNMAKITHAGTVTTIKSTGIILHMVTETVTSYYQGCYKGFHLNYNSKNIWLELMINSQSTCSITTNQTYFLTLASKNSTQVNITQISQVLNSTTKLVNISYAITDDILAMIRHSQFTSLLITLNQVTIDYLSLYKVVNNNMDYYYTQQLIILGVSMGISILADMVSYLIKLNYKNHVKNTKLILKEFAQTQFT
ncbi:Conserved_hypothetical protein [Hexamita inflata]|uniref:Transmembrane protein n=1 Tax=Hexamita inflata TaxID=28002 RepID=A0AA86TXD7_9EUKA|nr:Conserved hypothetical protein [Hexamita inflata]